MQQILLFLWSWGCISVHYEQFLLVKLCAGTFKGHGGPSGPALHVARVEKHLGFHQLNASSPCKEQIEKTLKFIGFLGGLRLPLLWHRLLYNSLKAEGSL